MTQIDANLANLQQIPYTEADDYDDDSQTNAKLPKLTSAECKALRQETLEWFFPGVNFSGDGGLKLAHDGALAVSICTGRMLEPGFYFGPRINHFTMIAQADVSYLVLCGVICDEMMVEQDRAFFAVPLEVRGDNAFVMGYPLKESKGGHYNINLGKGDDGWTLSISGNKLSLVDCDRPIGTVFVPAHLRAAPIDLTAVALPTTISGLHDCQEYAALVSETDPNVEIVCMLRRKS